MCLQATNTTMDGFKYSYLASLNSHSGEGDAFGAHTRTLLGPSDPFGSASALLDPAPAAGARLLCRGPILGPTILISTHLQALALNFPG